MIVRIFSDELMPLIKEMIKNGRVVDITVSGVSMRPFYIDRETIVSLENPRGLLKKYDVVLYHDHGTYKLHRIIGFWKGLFVIRGDALRQKEFVSPDAVIAKVTKHSHKGKVIPARSRSYLFKVFFWNMLYPARSYLLKLCGRRNKQ